jgi:thiol-disulfide isomerase/thioredoxin
MQQKTFLAGIVLAAVLSVATAVVIAKNTSDLTTNPAENTTENHSSKTEPNSIRAWQKIPYGTDANAADIVRAVRKSENWIHDINSIYLRLERRWTADVEYIAVRRAELQKQLPGVNLDPNRFVDLKPIRPVGIIEYAIDRQRLRFLTEEPDYWRQIKIWDGKMAMVHEKYFNHQQESYVLASNPKEFFEKDLVDINWLRSQPYSFWWNPRDVNKVMDLYGKPEDFKIIGREEYKGYECYVLEYDTKLAVSLSYRWYVGVKDQLLYRIIQLRDGKPRVEHWTLDYKEVAPGCLLPMTQGHQFYDQNETTKQQYISPIYNVKVVGVRINEKLSDDLFTMDFKEGVKVQDHRFGAIVTYPYKANRTDEEWQEIREQARKRAETDAADQRFKDALIGKPAPEFPVDSQWLNGPHLTWNKLRGKVVILDFWAEWCGPCRNDLPVMVEMHQKREESKIVVIGIHTPGSDQNDIGKIMKKYAINYPICIDVAVPSGGKSWGAMSSNYGVRGIPYAYVVDQNGIVAGHGWGVETVIAQAEQLVKKQ